MFTLKEKMEVTANILAGMGHDAKAYTILEYMESVSNDLKMLEKYRTAIQKLDKLYKPNSRENPFGLLDSPNSLIQHTKETILYLKAEDPILIFKKGV